MRIVHTADWHLNNKLGRFSRQSEITSRLEKIADDLATHDVEVMIVAGDLFSEFTRYEQLRASIADLKRVFTPFLLQGGAIVAIAGNHDNAEMITALQSTLELAHPVAISDGISPPGRLYLASEPMRLVLQDRQGQRVQFALFPYPTTAKYLAAGRTAYQSPAEKNEALHKAFLEQLHSMDLDPSIPSILVAHISVSAAHKHDLYRIVESQDIMFHTSELCAAWPYDYVALGHIHKPQALTASGVIQYSGSIERFDVAEAADKKGVWLLKITAGGLEGQPTWLPLDSTPIYHVEVHDPTSEMPRLRDLYPDAEQAYVVCSAYYTPGEHTRDQIVRELKQVFPRCYRGPDVRPFPSFVASPTSNESLDHTGLAYDVAATVRQYLQSRLPGNPGLLDMLALVNQLLVQEEATQ